jgi:hypothetical protein
VTATPEPPAAPPAGGLGPLLSDAVTDLVEALPHVWKAALPPVVAGVVITAGLIVALVSLAISGLFSIAAALYGAAGVSGTLGILGFFSGLALLAGGLGALLWAPFLHAHLRAHALHLQGGPPLGVADGWRHGWRDPTLTLWLALEALLQTAGFLLLFLPGLVVDAALGFVAPARIVHGLPLPAAIARSLRHFVRAPLWHIGLSAVDTLTAVALGSALPIVSGIVVLPLVHRLRLRAYLEAFPPASPEPARPTAEPSATAATS